MEARFWIWYGPGDGMVRLKLKPGQTLEWESGGPCAEGWGMSGEEYEHEGSFVRASSWSASQDCDGRHSSESEHVCPLDKLAAHHNTYNGLEMPDWREESASQRDYAAEAAGY